MIHKMTDAIYDTLKNKSGFKVFAEECGPASNVWLQFATDNNTPYQIRFISTDDNNDVAVRVFGLLKVENSLSDKVLPLINRLNAAYRFVKFVLDNEGNVNLEFDYLYCCPNPAASAEEIVMRIVKIIEEAYPALLRASRG